LLWKFVFSPALLVLLILDDRREETNWCVLAGFFLVTLALSAALSRYPCAWKVVPWIILGISLIQGLFASEIVVGIHAIGHS
jgi:hypothetical protein